MTQSAKTKVKKRKSFLKHVSGLYHYNNLGCPSHLDEAVKEALETRPKTLPAWFWFNGTPAPIHPDDTPSTLIDRWDTWRKAYQNNSRDFLNCMIKEMIPTQS